ncbi:MAG: pullulanase-type alpha-1,6-glucosidase [Anaeromyxobacter sp.]
MTKHSMGRGLLRALMALALGAMVGACSCDSNDTNDDPVCPGDPSCPPDTEIPANTLRVHYYRADATYAGWGVYSWAGPTVHSSWPDTNRWLFASTDTWGSYTDIEMEAGARAISFLITKPDGAGDAAKDCGGDQSAALPDMSSSGAEIWVKSGDCTVYTTEPTQIDGIVLGSAKAGFVEFDDEAGEAIFSWPGLSPEGKVFTLYAAPLGGLTADSTGITNPPASYTRYDVTTTGVTLSEAAAAKWPRWAAGTLVKVSGLTTTDVKNMLTGQLVIAGQLGAAASDGTQVQTGPVLDDLYGEAASAAQLGVSFDSVPVVRNGRRAAIAVSHIPTFRLWAPTAKSVSLNLHTAATGGTSSTVPMVLDAASGVWSYTAPDQTSYGQYYTYTVAVFSRAANSLVVENTVTDPYSVSLSANSARSMILDLNDAATKPSGWDSQELLSTSAVGNESVIYELHIRDFSANDASAVDAHKGKYLAFADESDGTLHLSALAEAGLTHVHILPAFDVATIDEVGCEVPDIADPATGDSQAPADAMALVRNGDCYNWGYDPLHYGAPEGSYATNAADGTVRVKEFRQMVQALHAMRLRVVMDVVYNHTNANGQADKSVLDKIVPGYYNRLNSSGSVYSDTCCSDTATETVMFEKLMRETLVRWADLYKIDSFRHDLMGFIPKAAMQRSQEDLDAVAQADGRDHIYVYGEGWNFGAVANDALFVQATQARMAGTNIGTFNDRLRDAVRGGSPFDNGQSLITNQGFVNGVCYAPNANNTPGTACTDEADPRWENALHLQDLIEVGLAASLKDFVLREGVTGAQVDYNGQPAGYAEAPADTIVYSSKHDNQTLFDYSQYKLPADTSSADRARVQALGMAIPMLSQAVPFFQAGDDLLRSKSMDQDSYDSGDYFNRIWWDGSRNNWAAGLPPAWRNNHDDVLNWAVAGPALADNGRKVTATDIAWTSAVFKDLLAVRKSTSMFHLPTAAEIKACVSFPDQTIGQKPGVIVMKIGGGVSCGDNAFGSILVVFNATTTPQSLAVPYYAGKTVELHPVQAGGSDSVVKGSVYVKETGTFTTPARTVSVYVEPPAVGVLLDTSAATVAAGAQRTFVATVVNTDDTAVTWSVDEQDCGSVTAGGVYTAPAATGTCHVRATSHADATKSAAVAVTVSWIDMSSGTIDPMFGAANSNGDGTGWGAKVDRVYVTSHGGVLYIAAQFNPVDAGNNIFLYVDNTNVATGLTTLTGDFTLGWGSMNLANTAGANIDFAFAGWRGGTTLNPGPSHSIINGVGADVGSAVQVGQGGGVYKWAINYSAVQAAAGNAVNVYVLYGKDAGAGGVHSAAPAPSAAQVTAMNAGGLTDLDTAPTSVTLQ